MSMYLWRCSRGAICSCWSRSALLSGGRALRTTMVCELCSCTFEDPCGTMLLLMFARWYTSMRASSSRSKVLSWRVAVVQRSKSSLVHLYLPSQGCNRTLPIVARSEGLVFIRDRIRSFASPDTLFHSTGGSFNTIFPTLFCSNSGNLATSMTYRRAPSDQQSAGKP
jgi:hypothetical protein